MVQLSSELTTRVFDVPSGLSREARDLDAAARFLDTVVDTTPAELAREFR
jgi:hypothetical protein